MSVIFISRIIFFIAIPTLCTSCLHHYYAPNSNNIPLFKEKNEGRIQAQLSSGNDYTGFEFQSAYAVGKHTGLQLNFFTATGTEEEGNIKIGAALPAGLYYLKNNTTGETRKIIIPEKLYH